MLFSELAVETAKNENRVPKAFEARMGKLGVVVHVVPCDLETMTFRFVPFMGAAVWSFEYLATTSLDEPHSDEFNPYVLEWFCQVANIAGSMVEEMIKTWK